VRQHGDLAFIQQQVIGAGKAAFGHRDRRWTAQQDGADNRPEFGFYFGFSNDLVYQPDAFGFPGAEALTGGTPWNGQDSTLVGTNRECRSRCPVGA
jgi:hypothetical protein